MPPRHPGSRPRDLPAPKVAPIYVLDSSNDDLADSELESTILPRLHPVPPPDLETAETDSRRPRRLFPRRDHPDEHDQKER